ncbi:MAG: hypothetical protein HY898_25790 [Deltaproteobacteria bacterium]|nr:hypothetical protein [Deltaproteobacteria bacterium]
MRNGTWLSVASAALLTLAVSPAWSQGEPDKKPGDAAPAPTTTATEATPPPVAPPAVPTAAPTAAAATTPPAAAPQPADKPPEGDRPNIHHGPGKAAPKVDRAGDFMDTRLTWTLGDDDVLHATGLAYPLSPNTSIGDRTQYRLFFDNLNSRFSGRENLTHLVMYKKLPGFIPNLETEAALVMRVDMAQLSSNTGNLNTAFYDAGSYLRLFYFTQRANKEKGLKDTGLDLTFFPLDTDRFRLGYLYDLSWGGTAAYINQSMFPRIRGGAPGFKLQYQGQGFSVFGGIKTASITQVTEVLSPGTSEVETIKLAETNYGFLGGGSVDVTDFLRVDVGGGYFQQGTFELPDVFGQRVYTFGGSGRIVVHQNMPVPRSVDFLLYRNDPNNPQIMFAPAKYTEGEFSWAVSAEVDRLEQNLKDFDVPGATKLQPATAGAAQAVVQSGYLRASLTGIYRDLAFVVRNQPGYIPFQTMPNDAKSDPEKFFAASTDYYLAGLRLTPGIGVGMKFPSTFRSESTDMFGSTIGRTVVVREQGNISILPLGKNAVPIVQTRVSLRWDISEMMAAVIWGQYVRDNNATFVQRDPNEGTLTLRTFLKPDFIGFGASVQARF